MMDRQIWGLSVGAALLLLAFVLFLHDRLQYQNAMMAQCLADGVKEYECYGMIYRRDR